MCLYSSKVNTALRDWEEEEKEEEEGLYVRLETRSVCKLTTNLEEGGGESLFKDVEGRCPRTRPSIFRPAGRGCLRGPQPA